MKTRNMYRVAARFSAVALLVLLAACYRYPPPVVVSFPDDPRVLHGEWLMDVRLLEPDVRSFKYVPAHGLLLAWSGETVYGWQRQPDGSWLEADAAAFAGVRPADYDATLDAFVRFDTDGAGSAEVTMVTMPDGAREQVSFSLPAGVTVLSTATGSGRVFVHGRTADSGTRVWWWDARSGEAGSSTAVRNAPDGMKRSRNGSALSFWDLSTLGKGVQVIRTAAPETIVEFSLGICRTTGTGEASTDGRWFAVQECSDRISLVDLTAPNPGRSLTQLQTSGFLGFADDTSEVLHVSSSGLIQALDPVSRQLRDLFQLPPGHLGDSDFGAYWRTASLVAADEQLFVLSDRRQVLQVDLSAGSLVREFPETVAGTLTLQLAAADLTELSGGYDSYTFSGNGQWPASLGGPVDVVAQGTVSSHRLHDYRSDLGVQAPPPPYLSIYGSLSGTDLELSFSFSSLEAGATVYNGFLSLPTGWLDFEATLRRP